MILLLADLSLIDIVSCIPSDTTFLSQPTEDINPSIFTIGAGETIFPSDYPSTVPTEMPSSSRPSTSPSYFPTTVSPTISPSLSPEMAPTTGTPTTEILSELVTNSEGSSSSSSSTPEEETNTPTRSPEKSPTAAPSANPVASPSSSPTDLPTINPEDLIWNEVGQSVIGNDAGDVLGESVTMSGDSRIMAIGAPGIYVDRDRTGHVKLYRRSSDGSSREQIGQDIIGDQIGDTFGVSVAISADGSTLAIGAPANNSEEKDDMPGYVRLYSIIDDGSSFYWHQLGPDIIGEAPTDAFGTSVSLSEDGKIVAIGGYLNDGNGDNSGHVRIYQINDSESDWTQLGEDIDGEMVGDYSGREVSLSTDGSTVAIGSPYNSDNGAYAGQVRVYNYDDNDSGWVQRGQDLVGEASYDNFGYSVSISGDGRTIAIGAPADDETDDRPGYARVYSIENESNEWQQVGDVMNGTTENGSFGYSVSLSNDGRILAVGDYYAENGDNIGVGCVRVYRLGSNWIQLGEDIDGEDAYDYAGNAVSLSADGTTVAIGSPGHDENGSMRVFSLGN